MNIGEQIRKARKDRKVTMKHLGELIGLSEQAISQYERGERNVSIDTLKKIANVFGITINDLIGENNSTTVLMSGSSDMSVQVNGKKYHRTKYDNQRDFLRSSGISFKRTSKFKGDELKEVILLGLDDVEYSLEEFDLLMNHLIETVLLSIRLKKGE